MFQGRARDVFLISAALGVLLALGMWAERAERFRPLRDALRKPSVPTAMLNRGTVGRVFRHLRLVKPVRNDNLLYKPSDYRETPLNASLFQKKRVVGDMLYMANPRWVEDLAVRADLSDPLVQPGHFREGWPLVSIRIDERDLTGDEWGIYANFMGHGREWERPAAMAYYADGKKLFSTAAGLRLHGGRSREPGQTHSLRLHFREEYGENEFKKGVIFTASNEPVTRLVVHADWPPAHPFAGLLAFDVVERLGGTVPRTQPVLLVLNGQLQTNLYFLSEHVGRAAWANRIGHKDFLMYIMKGPKEPESFDAYGTFHIRMLKTPAPLDLAVVEQEVDLENLSASVLAVAYGGTSDGFQGAALWDSRAENPRWSWVSWDMDHSLWDVYGKPGDRKPWQKESWEQVMKRKGDPGYVAWRNGGDARAVIFGRLMDESPAFRVRFIRYATDMLNHRLTEDFMFGRIAHYEQLVRAFGRADLSFADEYREFVLHRPDILREGLQRLFDAGPAHRVELRIPDGQSWRVDGFEESGSYAGAYFDGQSIKVEPPMPVEGWRVNGERHGTGGGFAGAVWQDMVIEPVFAE